MMSAAVWSLGEKAGRVRKAGGPMRVPSAWEAHALQLLGLKVLGVPPVQLQRLRTALPLERNKDRRPLSD